MFIFINTSYLVIKKQEPLQQKTLFLVLTVYRDNSIASPGRWVMDQVSDIKAINSKPLKIELKSPFLHFLDC